VQTLPKASAVNRGDKRADDKRTTSIRCAPRGPRDFACWSFDFVNVENIGLFASSRERELLAYRLSLRTRTHGACPPSRSVILSYAARSPRLAICRGRWNPTARASWTLSIMIPSEKDTPCIGRHQSIWRRRSAWSHKIGGSLSRS